MAQTLLLKARMNRVAALNSIRRPARGLFVIDGSAAAAGFQRTPRPATPLFASRRVGPADACLQRQAA